MTPFKDRFKYQTLKPSGDGDADIFITTVITKIIFSVTNKILHFCLEICYVPF